MEAEQTNETAVVAVVAEKVNVLLDNADSLKSLFDGGKLDSLDKLEKNPINISMQYYDFSQGKSARFFFAGITEVTTQEGEIMPAVVLIDKEGDPYVNQGTLLVEAFHKNKIPVNTPVEVTWTGTKKTGKGNQVRTWRVNLLG